jgi:hypothetical protein
VRLDRLQSGYIWSAMPIGIDPVSYLLAAVLPMATLLAYVVYRDLWPRLAQRPTIVLPVAVAYGTAVAAPVFIYLQPIWRFIYFQF